MSDQRRHHRQRIIAKRLRLARAALPYPLLRPAGSLAKRKVWECSCWMCQGHKDFRWRRGKERHAVKAALRLGAWA